MDSPCIFLGIKVKPGPIERFKLDNYTLDNTVDQLKTEAEKKSNVPSSSLELIHHGKILKSNTTLQDCGVRYGEMVHVVKKKQEEVAAPRTTYTDAELQSLNSALRALGCTPNAPGWTRAMQLLNEESVMNEILAAAPGLSDDCAALSMLHEVELVAALGGTVASMRRGAQAHPSLPAALMALTRRERSRPPAAQDAGPAISGFAYSLEALSEEEDADEEEPEDTERSPITREQLAAALQAATEAVSASPRAPDAALAGGSGAGPAGRSFLELLRSAADETNRALPARARAARPAPRPAGGAVITPEMFSEAISDAITRAGAAPAPAPMDLHGEARAGRGALSAADVGAALSAAVTRAETAPMEHSAAASSSQSPVRTNREEDYTTQLAHMHEMGLLDDAVNMRALLICAGDVNGAINLVFSGAIGDD